MVEKSDPGEQSVFVTRVWCCCADVAGRWTRVGILLGVLAIGFFFPLAAAAETEATGGRDVLMLEVSDVTVNAPQLFLAIRAQLAASMSDIHRVTVQESEFNLANPLQDAATLAADHDSQMVFWVEISGDECTISFYFAEDGARLYVRQLHLISDSAATRYEVVANAVSSLIEETVFNLQEAQAQAQAERREQTVSRELPAPRREVVRTNRGVELRTSYRGSLFARNKLIHGVEFGLGIIVGAHLVLGLGYTHGFAVEWQTDRYRFSVYSKYIEASIAGCFYLGATQIRLGLAYLTQIRTFDTASRTENITPRRLETNAIFGIMPSVDVVWRITGKFSMATGVGASISFNERGYLITRDDGIRYYVTDPYPVNLVFRLGFVLQL